MTDRNQQDNIIIMSSTPPTPTQSTIAIKRPEFKASFLSIPTVAWITPLLLLGAKKPLTQQDLTDLPTGFKSNLVASYLNEFWVGRRLNRNSPNNNEKRPPLSLLYIVIQKFGWTIFGTIFFQCLSVACTLTIPTFLQQILYFLSTPVVVPGVGVVYDPKSKLFIQSGVALSIILTLLQIGSVFFQNTSQQLGKFISRCHF